MALPVATGPDPQKVAGGDVAHELTNRSNGLERMSHFVRFVHRVPIAAALFRSVDRAVGLEVGEDLLNRPIRYSNPFGNIEQPNIWILRKAQQHECVIG